jgi:hypothetical protein
MAGAGIALYLDTHITAVIYTGLHYVLATPWRLHNPPSVAAIVAGR